MVATSDWGRAMWSTAIPRAVSYSCPGADSRLRRRVAFAAPGAVVPRRTIPTSVRKLGAVPAGERI